MIRHNKIKNSNLCWIVGVVTFALALCFSVCVVYGSAEAESYVGNESNDDEILADGVYYFGSALSPRQVIDVSAGSSDNGANVQIYSANESNAQKWKIENQGDNVVVIRNVGSNKVLDVAGGQNKSGANVWQYNYNGSNAQKWIVSLNDEGNVTFKSTLNNNLVLDLAAGNAGNGSNIQVYASNNTNAQKFYAYYLNPTIVSRGVQIDEGYYALQSNKDTNYFVDLDGGSSNNGTNIHLWSGKVNTNDNQCFKITPTSDGFYTIANCNSQKLLDAAGGCVLPETNVWQYESNGTKAQKWNAIKNANGSYTFQNVATGLMLDVAGGNMSNGSNIQTYLSNGTVAQQWNLLDCTYSRQRLDDLAIDNVSAVADGTYTVSVAANSNFVVDVASGSKADGANVQLYTSNSSNAQKWTVSHDSAGYLTIKNVGSSKVLDVNAGKAASGTNVQQYTSNNTWAQKWIAVPVTTSANTTSLQLISGLSENVQLGAASSRIFNGTNLQLVSKSTATCNLFSIGSTPTGGTKEITTSEDISSGSFSSTTSDQNTIYAHGSLTSNISNVTVNKTGDTTNQDSSNFYGINSGILAKNKAVLIIKNSNITTNASGANGLFVYGGLVTNGTGDGSTATIGSSTITTSGDCSGGIMVAGGGILKALTGMVVKTLGDSSAAIRSDRGGGEMTITDGDYTTEGIGSPAIYCTADISATGSKLTSNHSEGVVIEGANSTSLNNCVLWDNNDKLNGQSKSFKNIFIYQSMSGDAKSGTGTFTAKNSNITTIKGDTFYVTNTKAVINLEKNTMINSDTSGNLLLIKGGEWGTSGKNGGDVTFNLTNQEVSGNIAVDSISTLAMTLSSGSKYSGTINTDNQAKTLSLSLSSDSSIVLNGKNYVTSFSDDDTSLSNIDNTNGNLYYTNGTLIW